MPKPRADRPHSVRIIAGRWRGRRIAIPRGTAVRPTPDRVRETVFNWLADSLAGATCLDLFAGTGALGLEALSRGASAVWLIERDPVLSRALRASIEALDGADATVLKSDAASLLRHPPRQSFDIVFLDPPYTEPLEPLLAQLDPWLADQAQIYVERARGPAPSAPLEGLAAALPGSRLVKNSRAANVAFGLLRFERPSSPRPLP